MIISTALVISCFQEMDSVENGSSSHETVEKDVTLPLPDAFLDFLEENGLDPSIYAMANSTPRYIRYQN